ncbi:MAG: glycoside hydrolase family 95 protein [Tannerella sp.]|jgi:alpha-L-fucosidase 2|nr:glycoside hydrolase family 95 protein [Tannerella sp.]
MKYGLIITVLCALTACGQAVERADLRLKYNEPAGNWNEALPIGNGTAGAMIFGGTNKETLSLNENTLYSGEPSVIFKDVKVKPETLDEVVGLMKKGEYGKANEIVRKNWLGRLHQYYQPLGDLYIESNREPSEVADYRRELDISEAVARTTFTQNNITITREIFASHADNVIVIRLTADKPDGLDVNITFGSQHPTTGQMSEDGCLLLKGKAPGYVERRSFEQIEAWGDQYKHPELYDAQGKRKFDKRVLYGDEIENKGMTFEARLKAVLPNGGKTDLTDDALHIYNTNEAYLLLALATSFNGYDKSPTLEGVDPSSKTNTIITNASQHNYITLKKRHEDDYKELFDRVKFTLPSSEEQKALPTDERIMRFAKNSDPSLAAMLFQFGRYLMISGSRQGGQPLNLQGIWNEEIVPAWNCGYTQNINTEMNYWPAEPTNLPECHEPLFRLIRELSVTGSETAREMYGRRGWVAHHNTSIWRESLPNDNMPAASFWPMVQGWYASHLWEHYLFNADEDFLRNEAYPLMKGAAEFFADWLIDDGNGYLVTPAGTSPENTFISDKGEQASVSMGPTMDMAIIRETFTRTVIASEKLGVDTGLRAELQSKLARLLPYKTGARGQLQEWAYDFKEVEPKHRHISHLYGLFPGDQITLETPELMRAAETSLNLRGDEATGWSMGWKINCWARLQDGDHAYRIIANLFNPVGFGNNDTQRGGLFKSMLDAHPPFQIDGNFGYTAGVTEMLLQSHAGYIQFLPALPNAWPEGAISGLKARGNFEVSLEWSKGALKKAAITSLAGQTCRLRASTPFNVINKRKTIATSAPLESNGKTFYEATFETEKGMKYDIY